MPGTWDARLRKFAYPLTCTLRRAIGGPPAGPLTRTDTPHAAIERTDWRSRSRTFALPRMLFPLPHTCRHSSMHLQWRLAAIKQLPTGSSVLEATPKLRHIG